MPYRKRARYPRTVRRRPKRVNKVKQMVDGKGKSSIQNIADKYFGPIGTIARTVTGLTQLINSEPKYIDTSSGGVTVGTGGAIVLLTGCAQGSTDISRNGNTILLKDITLKIDSAINASGVAVITRIMLFIDKEADGSAPTPSQLLVTPGNAHSMLNRDYSKRFVVIYDRNYDLSIQGQRVITDKFYKKLPIHTYYDGPLATVSDTKENQIYMFLMGSDNTNLAQFTYFSRVNFYDN